MRKTLHITDTDSVGPETPRDASDIAAVANQFIGIHPTTKLGLGVLLTDVIRVPVTMALLANSQVIKTVVGYPFILNSATLRIIGPVTTGAKAATLTSQISGVACTGGVISAAGTYATGATQAGTAVTALNVGTSSDTLEAAVSAVTTFAEGTGIIEFNVTRKTA